MGGLLFLGLCINREETVKSPVQDLTPVPDIMLHTPCPDNVEELHQASEDQIFQPTPVRSPGLVADVGKSMVFNIPTPHNKSRGFYSKKTRSNLIGKILNRISQNNI